MSSHFSFIKDSQNLIQMSESIKFYSKNKIYTADFESLYTNIPLENSIEIIMQIVYKVTLPDTDSYAFHNLLKLVSMNNYFYFSHNKKYTYFKQIKGVAMCTACGPSANLYLAYFEVKNKVFIDNSFYIRYIDDIFYSDTENYLTNKFPIIFPDLKLNTLTDNKVQFIDLNISLNHDFV